MPVLSNARHERFAQELATGKSASEAYGLAGFKPDRGAACRLSAKVNIRSRISELQGKAAERALITVESLTDDLARIAKKAEELDGAPGLAVARAAKMDIAKLNGLIIEKQEVTATVRDISDEPMTPEAWAETHATERTH